VGDFVLNYVDAGCCHSFFSVHTDASALPPVAPRPRTVSNQPNQSAFHTAGINKLLAFTIDTDCRTHGATPRVGLVTDQCRIYVKLTAANEFRLHPLYIACMNAGYCCSRRDVAWCVCVCVGHDSEPCKMAERIKMPFGCTLAWARRTMY